LSSEEQVSSIHTEFQKLQELQRYIAQLDQLRSAHAPALAAIDRIELTHSLQEERALLVHARVERILGVYQEMISSLPCSCSLYIDDTVDGILVCLDYELCVRPGAVGEMRRIQRRAAATDAVSWKL
jgi:hypothetical protein